MAKSRVNFATYPQDYYTGSQVKVFFGSIYVDDIATIQYTTNHSKAPLFGYNDHQFRAVAKGQLTVNGTFTIAFKETGYLIGIMNLLRDDSQGFLDLVKSKSPDSVKTFLNYIGAGKTPEQALDLAASTGKSKDFGGYKSKQDFEDIAEVLEDTIWGKKASMAAVGQRIPRSDELDYRKHTLKDAGSYKNDIDRAGFDILITFGDYRFGVDDAEHTMISINDVHVIGESTIITPAGEPVGMQYNFFARGLNEKVSSAWTKPDRDVAKNEAEEKDVPDEATNKIMNPDLSKQLKVDNITLKIKPKAKGPVSQAQVSIDEPADININLSKAAVDEVTKLIETKREILNKENSKGSDSLSIGKIGRGLLDFIATPEEREFWSKILSRSLSENVKGFHDKLNDHFFGGLNVYASEVDSSKTHKIDIPISGEKEKKGGIVNKVKLFFDPEEFRIDPEIYEWEEWE